MPLNLVTNVGLLNAPLFAKKDQIVFMKTNFTLAFYINIQ